MNPQPHRRTHPQATATRDSRASIRYVTDETTDVYDADTAHRIREICRIFETATEPLEAERTTSRMHGRMWELRRRAASRRQPDWAFGLGAPFARQLARVGGPGAKGLLVSLGHQAPPRLRELCLGLACDLPARLPGWAVDLPHAELTRTAATSWEEPEQLVLLEFRRRHHQRFTIAVMISDAKGGIARHYGLLPALDGLVELGDPDDAFRCDGLAFGPLEPDEACRRVRAAIAEADIVDERLVDLDSTKDLRAMTLSRIEPYLRAAGAEAA